MSSGGKSYKVEKTTYNTAWNPGKLQNDVALVKVASPIEMVPGKVEVIELNIEAIGGGEDLVLSGWGRTSYPGSIPDQLQFINLKSLSNEDCAKKQTAAPIISGEICTLTKAGEGACHGDSGGPLVYKGAVAGIVSWGRPCALGYPDVFTRVSEYIDWIDTSMKNN